MLFAVTFAANAADNAPSSSGEIKIEKSHSNFEVNSDGSYVVTRDLVYSVLTEEGVKIANHAGLSYSTSLDEAEILTACTLKKDGRRIDVPASNIQEREAVAGGGPMFSDIKAKMIIFPDVAVGDRVEFSYKRTRKTPLFPGQFSFSEVFSKFLVSNDTEIRVSVPINALDIRTFDSGVNGGRVEDKDGRSRWVWTYQNHEIAKPEVGSVSPLDYGSRIVVSSFKDYGAVAAAYEERAKPKAQVTEKVRALASELTGSAATELEKAKILCTWVAQNIRFARNSMGVGSVVPHEADEVLANRLGDCKDHVALLQALLAAAGIESTPVLLNAGTSYKMPEVASPSVLDHVITYIPSLDLYFDSSSEYVPFGQLPHYVRGKPAIHTRNFDGIRHTPACDYKADTSTMKEVLRFHEDGSAEGEVNIEETGFTASLVRALMAKIRPNTEDLLVRGALESGGYTGTGALTKADPRNPSDKYSYGIKFKVTGALNLPGPGALSIKPVFPGAGQVLSNLSGLNLPEITLDNICSGNISTEEFKLFFPKNVKIVSLPKDVHLTDDRVSYDSTYRLDGNSVTITRRFEDRISGPVCTPDEDRKYRSIGREVLKDLKAQIIFQPADGQ